MQNIRTLDDLVAQERCLAIATQLVGGGDQELELRPDPSRPGSYLVRGGTACLQHPGRFTLRLLRNKLLPNGLVLRNVISHKPEPNDSVVRFSLVLEASDGVQFLAGAAFINPKRATQPGRLYRIQMLKHRSEMFRSIRDLNREETCQRQLKL